jgi:hypothetical protein
VQNRRTRLCPVSCLRRALVGAGTPNLAHFFASRDSEGAGEDGELVLGRGERERRRYAGLLVNVTSIEIGQKSKVGEKGHPHLGLEAIQQREQTNLLELQEHDPAVSATKPRPEFL